MGNFAGTVVAPIAVTSEKATNSTSKKSGSECNGSGDSEVISKEAVKVSIDLVKTKLELEMYKHEWRITQIKRAQTKLCEENDRLWLHGYIVLKLVNDKQTKFCRIDWGSDGLHHEMGCEESKLTKYSGHLESLAESHIGIEQYRRNKRIYMAAALPLAAGTTPATLAIAVGAAVVLTVATKGTEEAVDDVMAMMNKSHYEDVPLPESALRRLIKYLEKEIEAPRVYDLGFHNCNHFANELRSLLLENNV